MTLSELLKIKGNSEILTINVNASVAEAASKLTENKIGALLVNTDGGHMAGIISERDIVGGMGQHGADLHDVLISELMTKDIVRCNSEDTVLEAMAMMTDRRIRHMPVFDGQDLIGFISVGDLVKCRIAEVQTEAEAMRQYIAS